MRASECTKIGLQRIEVVLRELHRVPHRPSASDEEVSKRRVATVVEVWRVEPDAAKRCHACAIANGSVLYCWGFGGAGQLGNGKYGAYAELRPQRVSDIDGVEDVVVGTNFTCARKHGGTVSCWGANADGQLALGDTRQRILPTGDRVVSCWGWNGLGQLGNGRVDANGANPTPARVEL